MCRLDWIELDWIGESGERSCKSNYLLTYLLTHLITIERENGAVYSRIKQRSGENVEMGFMLPV